MNVESSLPIAAFRDEVINTVVLNKVTIVTAETGAGKSTQVPQYLCDAGLTVIVTEPRRLAARLLAERVAEERESELGREIGYRTGKESCESNETQCLFATDGLAMIRELVGLNFADVLVIDEVHEWNLNIEVLVAWVRREIESGRKLKVVLMSATLESEKLSKYFDGAPIVKVPGRMFPVEVLEPVMHDHVAHAAELARQGRNVLVFEPGKEEIAKTIETLKRMDVHAEILPLHGELDATEQKKCFKHFGRPKIVVSTNVAQTSVTIDDIDAVVDSGLEKRIETVNGVEGLYLRPVSVMDSMQRKGRAGRTKPGLYVDYCPESERPEFPVAEILRLRLDQVVLRLAEAGFDAEGLAFFHQPEIAKIHQAKEVLKSLGCMTKTGSVTSIGREVSRLPLSVRAGRMVVEAVHRGVVQDVITIAAILESGEINMRKEYMWRTLVRHERDSDLFAQLELYRQARRMRNNREMEANGIMPKAYYRAVEMRKHIVDALRGKISWSESSNEGNRGEIIRCIVSGLVDHVYVNDVIGYRNGDKISRRLNRDSVVCSISTRTVVGIPRDIEITDRYKQKHTLNLVSMVTKITPELLCEVAPHLVTEVPHEAAYDEITGDVVMVYHLLCHGVIFAKRQVPAADLPDAYEIITRALFKKFQRDSHLWPTRIYSLSSQKESGNVSVIEHAFAVHPRDGKSLKAYGTLRLNEILHYYEPTIFWTLDKSEAEESARKVGDQFRSARRPIPSTTYRPSIPPLRTPPAPRVDTGSGMLNLGDLLDDKLKG